MRLPAGPVFLERRTLRADFDRLLDVFGREPYATDYTGATVLDIGAHKGYFAAYALAQGARAVRSYEPAGENLDALARSAAAADGFDWTVQQAAVRTRAGTLVHTGSPAPAAPAPGRVDVVAATQILPMVAPAEGRLIARLDVDGAECDVVLGTPPSRWHVVDELFLELREPAPCERDELVAHLERAGLVLGSALADEPQAADVRFVREQPRRLAAGY